MTSMDAKDAVSEEESYSESSLSSLEDEEVISDQEGLRVDLTPHKDKQVKRKAATHASEAWSGLGSRRNRMASSPPSTSASTPSKRRKQPKSHTSTPSKKTPGSPYTNEHQLSPLKHKAARDHQSAQSTLQAGRKDDLRNDGVSLGASLVQPTSSDAYFVNHASLSKRLARNQTSDRMISQELPNISTRSVASMIKRIAEQCDTADDTVEKSPPCVPFRCFDAAFEQWHGLMSATGRPLMFYGVGSKRALLQRFVRQMANNGRCAAIVVRGEAGGRIEDIVVELERACAVIPSSDVSRVQRLRFATPLEARVDHLVRLLSARNSEGELFIPTPAHFLLLIHSIQSPSLYQERALRLLAKLTKAPRILLCADTNHISSGLLGSSLMDLPWLWVDATTYVPMLDEVLEERGAGIGRQIGLPSVLDVRSLGGGSDVGVLAYNVGKDAHNATNSHSSFKNLTDRAAIHILQSVTFKARGLFLLLAGRLLLQPDATSATTTFSELELVARNNFLAMTPDALKSLLVEFTSHGLIFIGSTMGDGQSSGDAHHDTSKVHIALTRLDLQRVVDEFKSGS